MVRVRVREGDRYRSISRVSVRVKEEFGFYVDNNSQS
jgi:hypothetical protein